MGSPRSTSEDNLAAQHGIISQHEEFGIIQTEKSLAEFSWGRKDGEEKSGADLLLPDMGQVGRKKQTYCCLTWDRWEEKSGADLLLGLTWDRYYS